MQLSGRLALSAQTVGQGDRLLAAYTLSNPGVALNGVPLTVSIVDPDTQAQIAQVATSVDLASGASLKGEASKLMSPPGRSSRCRLCCLPASMASGLCCNASRSGLPTARRR
ncbi:hypothetical protein LP420_39865 [Massilia sp. B-10]|nr:hypothetical protein LP420_39865 [Massilia sp. B-10]